MLWVDVTGMKTIKSMKFPNQNNKDRLSSKFRSWNKTNKNKNMAHVKEESNKIIL
jgi:hypothetical protein